MAIWPGGAFYTFEHKTMNAQVMSPKKIVKPIYIRSNIKISFLIQGGHKIRPYEHKFNIPSDFS